MPVNVKTIVRAHPLMTAIVLTLLWHGVLYAAAEIIPASLSRLLPDLGPSLVNLVAAVVPVVAAAWLGWWREAGMGWRIPRQSWLLLLPVFLLNFSYVVSGLTGTAEQYAGTALLCLCVGVSEEMLSRGVVQRALQPLGPIRAAVWVGVLFGLGHALSALWFNRPWDDSLAQVISTTAFGFGYAALRWHITSIWPLAFLHAMDDFLQLRSPDAAPLWWQATIAMFFLAYGWWLLHRLDHTVTLANAVDHD
ncbi:CPBP family intramembrane glutamic endopeptidase [Actinoplanes sp. NPDC004185]